MKYVGRERLKKFYKKDLEVTTIQGNVFNGYFCMYVMPGDNDPEIEEIVLQAKDGRLYGIDTPDIVSIKLLEE